MICNAVLTNPSIPPVAPIWLFENLSLCQEKSKEKSLKTVIVKVPRATSTHLLLWHFFFRVCKSKGMLQQNPRAQLYCASLYVYLYTHTYYQPYHPWPFNRLKTSKCINLEHQKGVSHKTKNLQRFPQAAARESPERWRHRTALLEKERSPRHRDPSVGQPCGQTKTCCQPVNLQSHTCWMLQKSRKKHHLFTCYPWNSYEKWDTLQMNLCRFSSINSCFWNNQARNWSS